MLVALLVLPRGVLGRHPVAVASGIQRGHVDLRLALDHDLGEVAAGASGRRDAEGEAFGQPHVAQPGGGAKKRVPVRRVADRAVEVVLEARRFRRRNPVDHRHVFLLDPVEIEREEVGAEAFGNVVEKPRGRAALVGAENPPSALLANVPLGVRVAQHGVLGIRFAPLDERGVGLGHDVLVLDRNRGNADAEQPGGSLRMVAGRDYDVLGMDGFAFAGG